MSLSKPPAALRLWSIQTLPAWQRLLDEGRLTGDGRRAEAKVFRPAYRWMMAQMAERVTDYRGGFPIWGWYRPKPDLRCAGLLMPGTEAVRIELSVSADRALLSDFDSWHAVLNLHYLSRSENEDNAMYAIATLEQKRQSWQRIFDLRARPYSPWCGSLSYVQAVVEEIRLSDVLSVRHFVAR